jgi:hypothetical protein
MGVLDINSVPKRQLIVSDGATHYVMQSDGSYSRVGVPSSMLLAAITDLDMIEVFEHHFREVGRPDADFEYLRESINTPAKMVEALLTWCATPAQIVQFNEDDAIDWQNQTALVGQPGSWCLFVPGFVSDPGIDRADVDEAFRQEGERRRFLSRKRNAS